MKLRLALLLLLHVLHIQGTACSCSDYPIDLPVAEMGWMVSGSNFSGLIFRGTLVDYYEVKEKYYSYTDVEDIKYELLFEVTKSYKGYAKDTVKVRTNRRSDACGFYAPKGTECLIFANKKDNGYYYTYRSDCCKSISRAVDEKRFNKYLRFLESILQKTDGEYVFMQTRSYWQGGYINQADTLEALRYTIKNGTFEGLWKLTDRRGRVLEEGKYVNGKKVGKWKIVSFPNNDFDGPSIATEIITYKNGRPQKSKTIVEDKGYNFEKDAKSVYKTARIQKIRKRYKYQ